MKAELIKAPADTALHPHLVLAKLERLLGLRYLPHQWTDLLRLLKPAASELRFPDVQRCLAWLEHEEQTTEHVHILARHLTIGESYFFREIVLFSLLRDTIVPNILRRKSETGDSLLRVWSAGCSTGEEAYSLAIVIASMLPDDSPMRVQILGTDVNPTAVQRAREGRYREWSFRDMSPGLKDMWFDVDGEQRYTVKERLRSMTHFETLNLIDAHNFPLQMDIILCRNVLMYFTRQVVQDIITGFTIMPCVVSTAAEDGGSAVAFSLNGGFLTTQSAPANKSGGQPLHVYPDVANTAVGRSWMGYR